MKLCQPRFISIKTRSLTPRNPHGFSLVEAMVALAIFAIVASGLTVANLRTQQLAAQTRNITIAVTHLKSAADFFLTASGEHPILSTQSAESERLNFIEDVDPDMPGVQVLLSPTNEANNPITANLTVAIREIERADDFNYLLGATFTIRFQFQGRIVVKQLNTTRSVNL